MNVFVSAGEASGDAYAGAITRELNRLSSQQGTQPLSISGIGGPRFREAGGKIIADSSRWGAISILQALKVVPKVLASYYRAKWAIRRLKPGLFIPIDFGYANIRLARHAKGLGWKVLYFVPPGSWRRDRQGKDLAALTDQISTPFSWSAEILAQNGCNVHWFGHPIKQLLKERGVGQAPDHSERIAVLPGSRNHEIEMNLPLLVKVTEPIEFGLAPSTDLEAFKAKWAKIAPGRTNDLFTLGDVYGVLTRSRAAIVCSGTATLEAALCRCPMVVIYRLGKSAEVEAKIVRFKLPRFVALPNMLLERELVPELIQSGATVDTVATEIHGLLTDPERRQNQLRGFEELDLMLGESQAITKTAELALSMLK